MPRPQRKEEILRSELPPVLPLMALRSTIVYPLGTIAVQMGAPENLSLLRANEDPGVIVALVVALGDHDEPIDSTKFTGKVGVAARVHERINLPGDTVQITLQGLRRITIEGIDQLLPFPLARVTPARELPPDDGEIDDLVARVTSAAETLANLVDRIPDEVPAILKMNVSDPGRFADLAATNMNFRIADKDEVLQKLDVGERLRFILTRLEREVARARVMEDVKKQTEIKIEQHQREFYLRQQLRAIQAELGETDPGEKEAVDLLRKVDDARLPEKVGQEARREIERLRMLSPASSEYQVVRTYLDWVLALPWNAKSGEQDNAIDLAKVDGALSERHYGLDEAKDRIVEYLAVRKLRATQSMAAAEAAAKAEGEAAAALADVPVADGDAEDPSPAAPLTVPASTTGSASTNGRAPADARPGDTMVAGPILCFAGPPGTGKTSLGEVIARAIGRQFYRISVGGVRDEAEVRGHRRTYVGSMPGLLIQALRRVGVRDPVFLIDEIDKMSGGGPSGDPTAAMLEVLDPSQNQTFVDHYLNLPFDLSQVLFICTANNLYDIPGPLRDRMEVIRIAGYTIEEKVEIAWRYTIPKLLEEHGLTEQDIVFTDEVLSFVASRYSREAGLRNFGRNLATLMRKRARREGGRRAGRLGAGSRDGRGRARPAALRDRGGGEGGGDRRGDRSRVDVHGRRPDGDRGAAHARHRAHDGHRPARRRDARERRRGALLRALARRVARHRGEGLQGVRRAHPLPRGRDPEGRSLRGHRDHAGAGERVLATSGAPRSRDDGRGHAARQGAGDRRGEGEGAGRLPRRAARADPAEGEREGPARRPEGGARAHRVHVRHVDGRGAARRAAARPGLARGSGAGRRARRHGTGRGRR